MKVSFQTVCLVFFVTLAHLVAIAALSPVEKQWYATQSVDAGEEYFGPAEHSIVSGKPVETEEEAPRPESVAPDLAASPEEVIAEPVQSFDGAGIPRAEPEPELVEQVEVVHSDTTGEPKAEPDRRETGALVGPREIRRINPIPRS